MQHQTDRTTLLAKNLEKIYELRKGELLFHGWHHICLAARKSVEFAEELGVDKEIVEAAALTHDLNYLVNTQTTGPEAGADLRRQYLSEANFSEAEIGKIDAICMEEHTAYRHANISDEAKALSDADSLFKIMPVGPILFSSKFITETKVDLRAWAERIIREQKPLMEQGTYFYTKAANEKYLAWAKTNLELVEQVLASLDDPAIVEMLDIAYRLEAI